MQKSVRVKTRKFASKAANILRRCRKLGVMSKFGDESTLNDT
jgi:hypothetical protein